MKEITVTIGEDSYTIPKEKEDELRLWITENGVFIEEEIHDELVVDIEETSGVEIEYNELSQEDNKDEARREESE